MNDDAGGDGADDGCDDSGGDDDDEGDDVDLFASAQYISNAREVYMSNVREG